MAEGFVNVTEGSGKKLHTWNRTIGGNDVHDEFTLPGEHVYASYTACFHNISAATNNSHILAIWCGSSLNIRIRRIWMRQHNVASAAGGTPVEIWRTSSVTPSGGTAVTLGKMDNADATANGSAMTLPTTKGTESGVPLLIFPVEALAARPFSYDMVNWEQRPSMKPILIAAGTTNGFAIKWVSGSTGTSVSGYVEFQETNFV